MDVYVELSSTGSHIRVINVPQAEMIITTLLEDCGV